MGGEWIRIRSPLHITPHIICSYLHKAFFSKMRNHPMFHNHLHYQQQGVQLAALAGFKGAGLERFMKLAFVMGFPNTILIELQQALNIETLTMGDLLARARVLTTGDQSQDVAVAVRSSCSGIAPAAKRGSISSMICHRCKRKGHSKILPEAQDRLFLTWWDLTLSVGLFGKRNRGQGISASLFSHRDVNMALPAASIYVMMEHSKL